MATPAKRRRCRRKKKSAAQGPSGVQQTNTEYWGDCVHSWYPKLQEETYFCPPQKFNRVPYDITSIAGQSVLVPQIAKGGAVNSLQKTQNSTQSTPGQPTSKVTSKDSHSEFEVEYESEEKTESESDCKQSGYSQYTAETSSEYQSVVEPDYVHILSPLPIRQDSPTWSMYSQSPSLSTYAEHSPPETSTSLSSYAHPPNPYYPTVQMSPARDETLQSSEQIAHIPNETYALNDNDKIFHALPMYEDFAQPTFTQSSFPQALNMQPSTRQSTQPFPHLPVEHPQRPETQQALKYQTANKSMSSTQYQCREMHHVHQTSQLQQANQVLPYLDAGSHQSLQKWQVNDTHSPQSANISYEHSNESQQSQKYEEAKHPLPIPHTHKMWKCHAGPVPIVPDCHVRDDKASQRVLACIQELSKVEKQVMMVISQLEFGHYLNKPCLSKLLVIKGTIVALSFTPCLLFILHLEWHA